MKKATNAINRIDCFAYNGKGCQALIGAKCNGCKFYKTAEQNQAESNNAKARAIDKGYYLHVGYEPKEWMKWTI